MMFEAILFLDRLHPQKIRFAPYVPGDQVFLKKMDRLDVIRYIILTLRYLTNLKEYSDRQS